MKGWKKVVVICLAVAVIALLGGVGWYISNAIPIGTGYAAKYLCSSVYISQRDPDTVFREDIAPLHFLYRIITARARIENGIKTTTASSYGLFKSTAIYRQGCGCTLVVGTTAAALTEQAFMRTESQESIAPLSPQLAWPLGDRESLPPPPPDVDSDKLKAAIDLAFAEPGPEKKRNTRATLVVYDGQLIAERYAPGFHRKMPLLGWSMSKSVTNALVGVLVARGEIKLNQVAPVDEWRQPNDLRGKITVDMLLRMSSGLKFEETYAPFYMVTEMLYGQHDFGAFAANQPLESEPDSAFYYSSGTANIIARIVRQTAKNTYPRYYTFLQKEFFHAINIYSAIMEPDPSGTFVGSSYTFATPRDWARFGLLFLQNGRWNGKQILPANWVAYTTNATPKTDKGEYGALFWLNMGTTADPETRRWPRLPRDTYCAIGFQEQYVCMVPSKNLVAVRFGLSNDRAAWNLEDYIENILAALPNK